MLSVTSRGDYSEGGGHAPQALAGSISLAMSPGALVQFAFHAKLKMIYPGTGWGRAGDMHPALRFTKPVHRYLCLRGRNSRRKYRGERGQIISTKSPRKDLHPDLFLRTEQCSLLHHAEHRLTTPACRTRRVLPPLSAA
jgi:hypothetical protein